MESNYHRNLKIEDYALLSNRSISSFKRDFQTIFKSSPHKWITEKRLQLAFTLMRNGLKKPSEIYLEVGYEDFSHFSKAFKNRFGVSPSEANKALV
jgi:AraC family transcriptional regulator, exoenzyme S synthesis regulatory protein ExsA